MLGTADDSTVIREDWRSVGHMIVQGSTRSGKSAFTYALLAQLSECAVIGGSDPTGLLFRPFAGTRHEQWQASGLVDLGAHEYALTAAVEEMDKRIRDIPAHRDTVPPSVPLLVIVLEELPGLLRALDVADKDRGKRCRALIARLLAEGAKAGLRVVMLAQRAEASIIGAAERAQASLRLSFRVDNRASVELLHPGCPPAVADAHTAALPGIGLLTAPGRPLTRLRAPLLGGDPDGLYAAYIAAVRRSHGLL
jgi:S-DNA-T family DNA segregation ATPase FtsK/SpoIIIE